MSPIDVAAPTKIVLLQQQGTLPGIVARKLLDFLGEGCDGNFTLNIRGGKVMGAKIEEIVRT